MAVDTASGRRLMSELQALSKEKWVHIDVNERNLHLWNIGLMVVNQESVWNQSYLKAQMKFSDDYPFSPPKFTFVNSTIYHPNVYPNGEVCISILHKPGEDEQSGEQSCERWSPLQGAESVLRSVLLLLDDPEINSPANVDASVTYRDRRAVYNARAAETASKSRVADLPPGVVFPTPADLHHSGPNRGDQKHTMDDDAFWQESDDGDDFDFDVGSDSDLAMDDEDEDDEDDEEEEEQEEEERGKGNTGDKVAKG